MEEVWLLQKKGNSGLLRLQKYEVHAKLTILRFFSLTSNFFACVLIDKEDLKEYSQQEPAVIKCSQDFALGYVEGFNAGVGFAK